MGTKTRRQIVEIDESKCNGCGVCIPNCVEGALKIVDGKAKLVKDSYCDGLGACLGTCPQDAIRIVEREAEEFDETAAMAHAHHGAAPEETPTLPCGCPSTQVREFSQRCSCSDAAQAEPPGAAIASRLSHWPVQLALVPPTAPFLIDADIVLVADCVPFAYADFHRRFLRNKAVLVACPKLDDFDAHLRKLAAIVKTARPRSIEVVHMEVPCCSGLVHLAQQATILSGVRVRLSDITIGIQGEILARDAF